MFHEIDPRITARMRELEALDAAQRKADEPRLQRLCQVPPETGRFLALQCAASPPGVAVEVGTSGGYSAMWLSLACAPPGRRLVTFERLEAKLAIARETFSRTGIAVEQVFGDAREHLAALGGVGFCFLDAEKSEYRSYYEAIVPRMVKGGLLLADNITSHHDQLAGFVEAVSRDARVDAVVVPIGKGVLLARVR